MIPIKRIVFRKASKIILEVKRLLICFDVFLSKMLFLITKKRQNRDSCIVHQEFYKQQYVAHGRFRINYPNNSILLFDNLLNNGYRIIECDIMFTRDNIPVLCHDENIKEFAKYPNGMVADVVINKVNYSELIKFNFSVDNDDFVKVTNLEELLILARHYDACVELDLNKKYLGRAKYRILYNLVKEHKMLSNVIWEINPYDFYSIARLDRNLIYQLDNQWSISGIMKNVRFKKYASLIILSQWFPDEVDDSYKDIIRSGHEKGFLMKCATLNNVKDTCLMFSEGVDLITTDTLYNYNKQ